MTLVVQVNTLSVWVGPADGSPVDRSEPTHAAPYLTPLTITRSMGFDGDNLDHAVFDYNLAMTGQSVSNISTPVAGYSRQVEIHWEQGGGVYTPIFWGDLTQQAAGVGRDAFIGVTASVYPYHFGEPLAGPNYYSVRDSAGVVIEEPIEFNPIIDGEIEGNMSTKTTANATHYWGDPESFRTTEAGTYQVAGVNPWTIEDAVKALCWECNESEDYIKNPTTFPASMATAPTLQNVTMDAGQYLPYYLDHLLHAHGYDWGIELAVESGATVRRIKIVDRGDGTNKTLKQQPPGETLNLVSVGSYTDTAEWQVNIDIGNAVNEVQVLGGHWQHEGTFELYRGWPEADDILHWTDLAIDDDGSDYYAGKMDVWRLWVANEAGDYCGTRTTTAPIPATPPDWSTLGVLVERRRRFEDPLSKDDRGQRQPPFVEWSDDAGTTWKPVPPEWSYRILDTECGIWFSGNTPPEELMVALDDARIRISAVVSGDERIKYTATDTDGNCPNDRTNRSVIEMPDAFMYREKLTTGDYKSELTGTADTRMDTTEIQAFAEATLAREVSAMVDGQYALVGVRFDYQLGDIITSIAGRNVSLNRNASGGTVAKYPQITAITWRPQEQVTQISTTAYEAGWYRRNQSHNSRYSREI